MLEYRSHFKLQSMIDGMYGASPERMDIKRTVIQGMKPRNQVPEAQQTSEYTSDRIEEIALQPRPLVGVLYSVTRDSLGEIFPVYVGRNTIGQEEQCDIFLPEDTVSPNHAVLLIRMLPDASGRRVITASITDYDSDFGTAVNGLKVGFDSQPLAAGDIISIGNAYTLLFQPLDAARYGLEQAGNFIPVPRKRKNTPSPSSSAFYTPASQEEIYPSAVQEEDEFTFYGRTYAKKEDHSSNKTIL